MSYKVGFWTEVRGSFPDAYWSFLSRDAIRLYELNNKPSDFFAHAHTSGLTTRKIAAYATSMIPCLFYAINKLSFKKTVAISCVVPIATLIFKWVIHSYLNNNRVLVQKPTPENFIGFAQASHAFNPVDNTQNLEVGKTYSMTVDAAAELNINLKDRGHLLPQGNTAIYSVPPVDYEGTSNLYIGSYFDVQYMGTYNEKTDRTEEQYYEIVRHLNDKQKWSWRNGETRFMTIDELLQLALIPSPYGNENISLRPEYVGSFFRCEKKSNVFHITRCEYRETYQRIPFNTARSIGNPDADELKLQYGSPNEELIKGEIWTPATSSIPEYATSVFMVKKLKNGWTVVRMLKPKAH